MKKQEKEVTAQEMFDEAERLTQDSNDSACYDCEEAWADLIGPYYGEKRNYAGYGVFKDACDFFVAREQDLRKGTYAVHHFIMRQEVKKILSFDFNYDYDSYTWDEKTYNLEDGCAFDISSESDELSYAYLKREVVNCLRSFLLTGAVLAKKIGSDTYVRWRKLIADLDYARDLFDHGADKDDIEAFLKSMDEAAELYVVDAEVSKRLVLSQSPKKGKKAKKKG